jgi:hypothetical protein
MLIESRIRMLVKCEPIDDSIELDSSPPDLSGFAYGHQSHKGSV